MNRLGVKFQDSPRHQSDRVEKELTPPQPIGFDLLVNGLGCRQTEAQWSFDYLYDISSARAKWGLDENSITNGQLYRTADASRRPGVGGDADPVSVGASSRRGEQYRRSSADRCAAVRRVIPREAGKKHISGRTGPLTSR